MKRFAHVFTKNNFICISVEAHLYQCVCTGWLKLSTSGILHQERWRKWRGGWLNPETGMIWLPSLSHTACVASEWLHLSSGIASSVKDTHFSGPSRGVPWRWEPRYLFPKHGTQRVGNRLWVLSCPSSLPMCKERWDSRHLGSPCLGAILAPSTRYNVKMVCPVAIVNNAKNTDQQEWVSGQRSGMGNLGPNPWF